MQNQLLFSSTIAPSRYKIGAAIRANQQNIPTSESQLVLLGIGQKLLYFKLDKSIPPEITFGILSTGVCDSS